MARTGLHGRSRSLYAKGAKKTPLHGRTRTPGTVHLGAAAKKDPWGHKGQAKGQP